MPADLITLSREYGAGASELAAQLGARLGWRVLDSEIPLEVARRLGIPSTSLEQWDEHAPGLLESMGNALLLGSPDLLIDPGVSPHVHSPATSRRRRTHFCSSRPPTRR